MIKAILLRSATTLALLGASLLPVAADGSGSDLAQVQVLPGGRTADGVRVAALQLTLPKGWKTYWRAPGDGGIPPMIDWSASRNLASLEPQWPTPHVFEQNGMRSVGYPETLLLPLLLGAKETGAPIRLRGRMLVGICKDICVPAELSFDATLPAVTGPLPKPILTALANRPLPAAQAGMSGIRCVLRPSTDGLHLQAEIRLPRTGKVEHAVVETADPLLWVAEPELRRDGANLWLQTELIHVEGDAFALDRTGIRITILGSKTAVDIQGCPAG